MHPVDSIQDFPFFSPVSKEWQIMKCNLLCLPFRRELGQTVYHINQLLRNVIPLHMSPLNWMEIAHFMYTLCNNKFTKCYKKVCGEIYRIFTECLKFEPVVK